MSTQAKSQTDLFIGVNLVENMDSATELEKKHYPVITAPEKVKKGEFFEVIVEVGKIVSHPNENTHYIEFIELYADESYLGRMDFTPRTSKPTMKINIQLDHKHDKLRAFARCNLHGTWEGDFNLKMSE